MIMDTNPIKRPRGRPRKNSVIAVSKDNPSETLGQEDQIPNRKSLTSKLKTPQEHWAYAKSLQHNISNHYAMKPTEQELAFYAALTLPKKASVVELGVTHGHTAAALIYACSLTGSSYTGIDNFTTEGSLEEANANLAALHLPFTVLKDNTHQINWKKSVDLVLFDAGHDHYNMRADVEAWLPRLKPGGLALFHEYNPKNDYTDPHFPVKHYTDMFTKGWEEVTYIPFLLIRRKPA
jgi:predicted O-methyltransferase YrrM